jgi:PAS domain S-box-containing protein
MGNMPNQSKGKNMVESRRAPVKKRISENELQAAAVYARSLIEASLDPLVAISPEGKITDVNKATEQVTGVVRELLIGSDFCDYFTDAVKAREGYQKALLRGMVKDYPLTIRHASGYTTDVLYNAAVYQNENGVVQGVFAAARDITERKAAEVRQSVINHLTELFARKDSSREYLESVAEVIHEWSGCRCVGIRVLAADGSLPYGASIGFDSAFLRMEDRLMLGADACLCTRAITQVLGQEDQLVRTPGGSFHCNNALEYANSLSPEARKLYRGTCIQKGFRSLTIVPVRYRDQIIGAIHLADEVVNKLSSEMVEFAESLSPLIGEAIRRFNAEEELRDYREHLEAVVRVRTQELRILNEELEMRVKERTAVAERRAVQLQELAAELELAEQRERRRLAMILHDGLQQILVAAKLNLGVLSRAGDLPAATKEISGLINEAIEMSRSLTAELGPPMLFRSGMGASLRWLVRWFHERHHLTVKLTAPEEMAPMPEEVSILLFRSVRELLFNVVKHAGSAVSFVDVVQREGWIRVSVSDEGAGFDPTQIRGEGGSSGGFGLFSISERLGFLGGKMEMDSALGRGSRFILTVPYSLESGTQEAYKPA